MRIQSFTWFVLAITLWGCSHDDTPSPESEEPSSVPDFIALGEDLEHVYQYEYHAATEGETLIDLTGGDAIGNQFISLRQDGEILTFYTFSAGSFSATQRNVRTGAIRTLEDIYQISDDRSVIWGTISEEKLYFGYYSPRGSDNFGMRIVDIATKSVKDMPLEAHAQNVYEPLYYNGKLFVTYLTSKGDYRTVLVDDATSGILRTWDFGPHVPSFFIDEAGDIALITGLDGNNYQYTIYDFDTLEKLSETPFSVDRFFAPGPLQAEYIGDKLYYLNYYAQPSPIPYGPAIYDFILGENRILDIIGIVHDLQLEKGGAITLTAHRYSPQGKAFLFGYASDFNNGRFEGGILVISEDGTLIKNIETSFVPIYFLE